MSQLEPSGPENHDRGCSTVQWLLLWLSSESHSCESPWEEACPRPLCREEGAPQRRPGAARQGLVLSSRLGTAPHRPPHRVRSPRPHPSALQLHQPSEALLQQELVRHGRQSAQAPGAQVAVPAVAARPVGGRAAAAGVGHGAGAGGVIVGAPHAETGPGAMPAQGAEAGPGPRPAPAPRLLRGVLHFHQRHPRLGLHGGHALRCLLHHRLQAFQHLTLDKEIQEARKGSRVLRVSAAA